MKSYTDLNQSKKLAEILPLESSDMRFCFSHTLGGRIKGHYPMIGREPSMGTIPCWSLAALLDILRNVDGFIEIGGDRSDWYMTFRIFDKSSTTLVDACYEMILELNKLNLL